jgi:holliday junction DNA helicase RuvB
MTDPLHTPIHSGTRQPGDPDPALRPRRLAEFVGQEAAKGNLAVFIAVAPSPFHLTRKGPITATWVK